MAEKQDTLSTSEGRIMFALGEQKTLLRLILCKISSSPKPQDSIPEKLIRYARQSSEALQVIASAIPYILNWATWIGGGLLVLWKWCLPFVRSLAGF